MIQQIEEFGSELQLYGLVNREHLRDRHVDVLQIWTWMMFRPAFPKVPALFCANAFVLNHSLTGSRLGSWRALRLISPTRSALSRPTPDSELSRPLRILSYGPDCSVNAPLKSHPPNTPLTIPGFRIISAVAKARK